MFFYSEALIFISFFLKEARLPHLRHHPCLPHILPHHPLLLLQGSTILSSVSSADDEDDGDEGGFFQRRLILPEVRMYLCEFVLFLSHLQEHRT